MGGIGKLAAVLAAALLCTGCAGEQPGSSLPRVDPADQLVVYTSHPQEIYAPLVEEFEARTGIWVQVVEGTSGGLLEQIESERQAPAADVMFGGGVDSLECHRDCFASYRSPACEAIDGEGLCGGENRWTGFSVLPLVFVYNTRLVDERDAPTGWNSLTEPKWTGRIAFADPALSGSCYTALATAVQLYGQEYAGALARNLEGRCLEESGELVPLVADGSYSVGVTLESTALQAIGEGADIAYLYPEDGTSAVADGVAILEGAPHRANAERFVDFVLGRDAQSFLCETIGRRQVRSDIPARQQYSLESLTLMDYDLAWAAAHKVELVDLWQQEYQAGKGGQP